jgi:hypothetical protein
VGVLLSASAAFAADPTPFGQMTIGTVGGVQGWGGVWRTGNESDPWGSYNLVTNGSNTYINAPSGTIYFRLHNGGPIADTDGWSSAAYVDGSGLTTQVIQGTSIGASKDMHAPSIYATTNFQTPSASITTLTVTDSATVTNSLTAKVGVIAGTQTSQAIAILASSTSQAIYGGAFGTSTQSVGVVGASQWGYGGSFSGAQAGLLAAGTGPTAIKSQGDIDATGYVVRGASFVVTSDGRVKKDVQAFTMGLSDLERVRPVMFKYNGLGGTVDSGAPHVGVIAQEVEAVAPFMVSSSRGKLRASDAKATDIKQLDPAAFTYMLVNAVKELSAENKQLRRSLCRSHSIDPGLCRRP